MNGRSYVMRYVIILWLFGTSKSCAFEKTSKSCLIDLTLQVKLN